MQIVQCPDDARAVLVTAQGGHLVTAGRVGWRVDVLFVGVWVGWMGGWVVEPVVRRDAPVVASLWVHSGPHTAQPHRAGRCKSAAAGMPRAAPQGRHLDVRGVLDDVVVGHLRGGGQR